MSYLRYISKTRWKKKEINKLFLVVLCIYLIVKGVICILYNHSNPKNCLSQNVQFVSYNQRNNIKYNQSNLPTIIVITPTHARAYQKAELTRLKNVFLHVPILHWIVIEDADDKTGLVTTFLKSSGLNFTHLNEATPSQWKLLQTDPRWKKPRGVLQRNLGLRWLRDNKGLFADSSVVYFADDDNTYSIELFKEMRFTRRVSVWPVALVGGVLVEKPRVDETGVVIGWDVGFRPDRAFATDMAGFAISLSLVYEFPNLYFSLTSQRGFIESDFIQGYGMSLKDLEPKADMCTKVYVWHTQTKQPNLKDEMRLRGEGKATDRGIEV